MFAMPGKLSALFTLYNVERWFGLLGGTLLLLFTVFADPWFGLPPTAWHCLGLPIIFLPMLGLCNVKASTAPYAHPTIYLFFGGFLLGLAMEKCNLHKRIALLILSKVGSCPRMQIAGFMFATGFISMWVSNTATAIMMLPIGISVASVVTQGQNAGEAKRFSCALMLAIAYSSSIGGMGTLIGTPPNALLRAFLAEHYHIHIGFGQWMLLGVPVAIALSLFTWWWLTRKPFNFAGNTVHEKIRQELEALGPVSREEAMTACLFGCAALCWVLQPIISRALPFVDDTFIAMCFGLLLFVMPVDMGKRQFLMNWQEARKLPWGILLLFGGGLSLAGAINSTGLASWMANVLGSLQGIPFILMTFILVITVQIMTEFTSNTATSAAFPPLVGIMAVAQGIEPAIYAIPAALAASCAFMLPVSTPPNAIVFRSGALTIPDMLRAGFALTLASGVIITLLVWLLVPLVFV